MMKSVTIIIALAVLLLLHNSIVLCSENSPAVIPRDYKSEVVLHLDYGKGSGKTGIVWGDEKLNKNNSEDCYIEPACLSNIQVLDNRFYFIDRASNSIVQYRSPNVLVKRIKIVGSAWDMHVSSKGYMCVSGGIGGDELACLDPNGKVVWSTSYEKLFSHQKKQEMEKEFNLSESYTEFRQIEWVGDLLQIRLGARDKQNKNKSMWVLLDSEGKLLGISLKRQMGSSKIGYEATVTNKSVNRKRILSAVELEASDKNGDVLPRTRLDFEVNNGIHVKGDPSFTRIDPDVRDGFKVHGEATMGAKMKTNSHFETEYQYVMWRFRKDGSLAEEWRFPQSPFAWGDAATIVDTVGSVYHVAYGDTGLDVVKYSHVRLPRIDLGGTRAVVSGNHVLLVLSD
jgi:hypothetical protein